MRALGLLSLVVVASLGERVALASPTWREAAKVTASDASRDARFGYAVALEGNTLVVGAPGPLSDPKNGAVYVFTRANATAPWALSQKLTNGPTPHGGGFGSALALRGDVLAVGAPDEVQVALGRLSVSGELAIFERRNGTWTPTATFWDSQTRALGARGQYMGTSVAFDGKTVVAGAPGGGYGDVIAFTKTSAGWAPTKRFADATETTALGRSVAIASGYMATGSLSDTVWGFGVGLDPPPVLGLPNACQTNAFGTGLALDGDTLVVTGVDVLDPTALRPSAGIVGIYTYSQLDVGGAPLFFFTPGVSTCNESLGKGTLFGSSVALRGDRFVVGAPGDVPAPGGAAYVYMRDASGGWQPPVPIRAANLYAGDRFGASVAIDGDWIAVGAPAKSTLTANDGAAFVVRFALPEGDACTSGDQCHSGSCVDGVCCADACGGGAPNDCIACSVAAGGTKDGACTAAQSTIVCRPAATECDVEDRCDGTARECPADTTRPNGSACSTGVCVAGACTSSTDGTAPANAAPPNGGNGGGCATASRADASWLGALAAAALAAIVARRRRSR